MMNTTMINYREQKCKLHKGTVPLCSLHLHRGTVPLCSFTWFNFSNQSLTRLTGLLISKLSESTVSMVTWDIHALSDSFITPV